MSLFEIGCNRLKKWFPFITFFINKKSDTLIFRISVVKTPIYDIELNKWRFNNTYITLNELIDNIIKLYIPFGKF